MSDPDQTPPLLRPNMQELTRIAGEVSEVSEIQQQLVHQHKNLKFPDRVAHQYQIAGGQVLFRVAEALPATLSRIGLFQPNAEHIGIGRISTGLGTPHIETNPDFLGARVSFMTKDGHRVDFLGIVSVMNAMSIKACTLRRLSRYGKKGLKQKTPTASNLRTFYWQTITHTAFALPESISIAMDQIAPSMGMSR
jgi:hypothetical protein